MVPGCYGRRCVRATRNCASAAAYFPPTEERELTADGRKAFVGLQKRGKVDVQHRQIGPRARSEMTQVSAAGRQCRAVVADALALECILFDFDSTVLGRAAVA